MPRPSPRRSDWTISNRRPAERASASGTFSSALHLPRSVEALMKLPRALVRNPIRSINCPSVKWATTNCGSM